MGKLFWQSKLWGLLHDPVFKPIHFTKDKGKNSDWRSLAAMQDWPEDWDPEYWNDDRRHGSQTYGLKLADYITSSSDRGAIGALTERVDYRGEGLQVSHLLSGAKLNWRLQGEAHDRLLDRNNRAQFLEPLEASLFDPIRSETDPRKVFWWCWRCLPEAASRQLGDDNFLLAPAETRLPDSSIWSHNSLTAAIAGSLAGYDPDVAAFTAGKGITDHPYMAIFSFSPIQELIKASRKLRDFWAGSWLLHYLSAKVCWALAQKYGPDALLYPSLFQQPLIDHWLLQKYPDFAPYIRRPESRELLTAGFPNVIVLILPKEKVRAAMQLAEETLRYEWLQLGRQSLEELGDRRWTRGLTAEDPVWEGWLKYQWQTYWSGLPIGRESRPLNSKERFRITVPIPQENSDGAFKKAAEKLAAWVDEQNEVYFGRTRRAQEPPDSPLLFQQQELEFLQVAAKYRKAQWQRNFSVNVGSWWPHIFDRLRLGLKGIKNARSWELPTVFSVRSSVSGLGPAVHNFASQGNDWASEGEVRGFWQRHHAGLFDGRELLNASETLKRVLPRILLRELGLRETDLRFTYPDLTGGAAGFVLSSPKAERLYRKTTEAIARRLREEGLGKALDRLIDQGWGIPAIDRGHDLHAMPLPSRLLDPSWLLEDLGEDNLSEEQLQSLQGLINQEVKERFGDRNPAGWYVLAAGDGDGMGKWLSGENLQTYKDYVPDALDSSDGLQPLKDTAHSQLKQDLQALKQSYDGFLAQKKRMGPSTHSALSRALLDFSNRLVPFLTESRYAGRLIYSGGDDVLAYTNLWQWDRWLWDIRQCFRGDRDPSPNQDFRTQGDYWIPGNRNRQELQAYGITGRPLFTLGHKATISFGVVIADRNVPMAIALENLWAAEAEAKAHLNAAGEAKDAVQVRVIYGNGNQLTATTKFEVFNQWRQLLDLLEPYNPDFDPSRFTAFFEKAAQEWQTHPAPVEAAIAPWTTLLCLRRDGWPSGGIQPEQLEVPLQQFLNHLWQASLDSERDRSIVTWLKLTAFVLRQRHILGSPTPEDSE